MKVWCDTHIHSCLSPCASEDMTPNNIVNMALLKGLELIAVCDHNTAGNLPAVLKAAAHAGLTVVPGMEITTREEVHVLAYFAALEEALACAEQIYALLPALPNNPAFFGEQIFMDEEDHDCGREEKLLLQAADASIEEIFALVRAHGGVPVPAHIDRPGHGILEILGFINPQLAVTAAELSQQGSSALVPPGAMCLYASDAHALESISERAHALELKDCSAQSFLQFLTGQKGR